MKTVTSVNGVLIRLTDERWAHIIEQHPELALMQDIVLSAISCPEQVLQGDRGQLIAVVSININKWLVVIYRELELEGELIDGFIVTAFLNSRKRYMEGKKQLWP